MTIDIFQHHNAVIHHPPYGNRQARQAHKVQGHPGGVHQQNAAEHAERYGYADNGRGAQGESQAAQQAGPQVYQKDKDGGNGKKKAQGPFPQQAGQGTFDLRPVVGQFQQLNIRRQAGQGIGDNGLNAPGYIHGVGVGVFDDNNAQAGAAVGAGNAAGGRSA